MKRKNAFLSLVLVAMLLLCNSFIFPAKATSYDWSKVRPPTNTTYDETIGKTADDGRAEVDMGIHIYQYIEGVCYCLLTLSSNIFTPNSA
jgi:hypothetical protein